MTNGVWQLIVMFGALCVSAANFAYTWHTTRHSARRAEIETLRQGIDAIGRELARAVKDEGRTRAQSIGQLRDRMTTVETAVHHLPTQESITQLDRRIGEVHGDMQGLREAIVGLKGQLQLISEHLLEARRP